LDNFVAHRFVTRSTNMMEPATARNITHLISLSARAMKTCEENLMNNHLMLSVAAVALIAGTGFANAQGTGIGREGGASAGSTVQQSAPPSGGAAAGVSTTTPNHEATESTRPSSGMKPTRSEQKSPAPAKNERAEDMQGQKSKAMNSERNANENARRGDKEMKAEGREDRNGMKAEDRNGNMNAETKGAMDSKSTTTTGQAGAGAKLSTEQRTRITTVIRGEHVAPVNDVNFSIAVGTRVPREISFHPLPAEVVTVYPRWRGYEFFLVGDQIVVVDPRTFEIVAILEA
jgi:hypothetical protein